MPKIAVNVDVRSTRVLDSRTTSNKLRSGNLMYYKISPTSKTKLQPTHHPCTIHIFANFGHNDTGGKYRCHWGSS